MNFIEALAEVIANRNNDFNESNSGHFGEKLNSVEIENLKLAIREALKPEGKRNATND